VPTGCWVSRPGLCQEPPENGRCFINVRWGWAGGTDRFLRQQSEVNTAISMNAIAMQPASAEADISGENNGR
jgi:hypothetical protein